MHRLWGLPPEFGASLTAHLFSFLTSMSATETTGLLRDTNGNGQPGHRLSWSERVVKAIKAEGEPSWLQSYRWFFFGSWVNVLLVFVPLSAASHFLNWDAALRFSFSFMAIVPLAKVRKSQLFAYPSNDVGIASRRRDGKHVCKPGRDDGGALERVLWQRRRDYRRNRRSHARYAVSLPVSRMMRLMTSSNRPDPYCTDLGRWRVELCQNAPNRT